MINKIKGLKRFTDCSMPSNEKERIEKAECAAYNQAIEDVVKLFAIPVVVLPKGALCFNCGKEPATRGLNKPVLCSKCWNSMIKT